MSDTESRRLFHGLGCSRSVVVRTVMNLCEHDVNEVIQWNIRQKFRFPHITRVDKWDFPTGEDLSSGPVDLEIKAKTKPAKG